MLEKTDILGVGITTTKEEKILEFILEELKKPRKDRKKIIIFTPNPEQLSLAYGNVNLRNLLNEAEIALPDGVGVVTAARILGKPIYARIAGIDFMKSLVKSVSKQPINTGYLGGAPHVAEEAAKCLEKTCPGLHVVYTSDTYDKNRLIHSDIDILFVGLGFPKQEQWIISNQSEIPATVIMAVGGSMDFISGRIPRAPTFLRGLRMDIPTNFTASKIFSPASNLAFWGPNFSGST